MSELVLIAEDEISSQFLIRKVVENEGMQAIVADSGRLAWEILLQNPHIALLITDMKMPEMDGEQLVRKARETAPLVELPIIMVSGVVKISEISDILQAGVSRFLPKPINVEHLKQYIRLVKSGEQIGAYS